MHKQTQKKIAMATILAVPTFALAQATPVGPFTGEFSDSFEGLPGGFIGSGQTARIFDDTADIGAGPSGNMLVFGGWSFRCVINPFDGGQGVGSASQPGEYTFDEGAVAFGGYFGSNADTSGVDGTIRFFDEDDNLIDDATITIDPDCQWAWNGWEFDTPVSRIQVDSGLFGGAFVQMDAMEVTYGGDDCRADLDGDGELTLFDFLAFQDAFDSGDPVADFDGDGELTLFDFLAFQDAFDVGCG